LIFFCGITPSAIAWGLIREVFCYAFGLFLNLLLLFEMNREVFGEGPIAVPLTLPSLVWTLFWVFVERLIWLRMVERGSRIFLFSSEA